MDRRTAIIGLAATVGGGVTPRLNLGRVPGIDDAAVIRTPGTGAIRSVAIRPVPLGGGGFVTGINQSADGKRFVCRTDVCNAYVRNVDDPAWRPLFSPTSMLPADFDPLPELNGKADGQGVAGVCIAPSNKDVIYASYYGYIWRSADGGKTIRRTALPQKMMPSNADIQRNFNRPIDVHPADANQILVGTWGEGTWFSRTGGKDWIHIDLPPAKLLADKPGLSLVLFGHRPDTVYVFVGGVGLFLSTTGADGHFALVAGGPTRCSSMVASRDGSVHLCEYSGNGTGGQLWRHHPETGWRATNIQNEMLSVTVDPSNPRRLFASGPYGYDLFSEDDGATFTTKKLDYDKARGEIGWIADLQSLIVSEVVWDVSGGDTIWYANGVGVLKADIGTRTLTDWSAGIEELIAISGLSVPGGSTILTAWDKPFWRIKDEKSYVNRPSYPTEVSRTAVVDPITHGTFVDYAADDVRFLVGVVTLGNMFASSYGPGFSTDGGESWTRFAGIPPHEWGYGGCIAASTRQNFILLPSNNGFGAYTHDSGRTWETIRLDGKTETSQFANAYYVVRKNITADKTRKGVFALVYTTIQPGSDPFGNPLGGVWLTSDGGKSWRQPLQGVINKGPHGPKVVPENQDARQFWRCQIEYVPGHTGELVYTSYADYGDDRLWWSRDDGATWTELHKSIRAVVSFGFGKPAPGQTRPAVYFQALVDGVSGTYASFDWFATKPALITRHASPQLANIAWVLGDANRFGRVWLGTGGAGWLMADIEMASNSPG